MQHFLLLWYYYMHNILYAKLSYTIFYCLQVNGKAYPKARLQLGHMGALHPANRLAAYITGRLDPVNLPGYPKSQDQPTSMANSSGSTTANDVAITSVTKATATPLPPKPTGEVSLTLILMVGHSGCTPLR